MTNKINSIESNLIQDLSNKESENINGGIGLLVGELPPDDLSIDLLNSPIVRMPNVSVPTPRAGTLAISIGFGLTSTTSGWGRSSSRFW